MHLITITAENQATCSCGWKGTKYRAGKIDGHRGVSAIKEGEAHIASTMK